VDPQVIAQQMNGFPAGPTRKKNGEKRQSVTKEEEEDKKKVPTHNNKSAEPKWLVCFVTLFFFCCIPISTLCCFIFSTRDGIVRSSNDKWINRKQKKREEKTQTAKSLRQSVNVSNDCRSISLCKLFIHIFTPDLFFTSL
jgi:hypothetical protein